MTRPIFSHFIIALLLFFGLASCADKAPPPSTPTDGPKPTVLKSIAATPIRITFRSAIAEDGLSRCRSVETRKEAVDTKLVVYLNDQIGPEGKFCWVKLANGNRYYFQFLLAEPGERFYPYVNIADI